MDTNYWSSMQQSSNRGNVPVANVVDLNQAGIMPYSGVEVIPAASLELLMNQQRLAGVSGISFLPYPGAAYATQVLDGSAVTAQTLLPGVAYNAVVTTAVEAQSQYAHPVSSSYSQSVHLSTDKNMTAANTLPVLNAVNQTPNNGQSVQFRQPLQSINLTDLLDYSFLMEHGVAEAAGTVDLRNPAVLANMLQSLNAASLPSASCSYERNSQVPQPVDIRQFSASKQPVQSQQSFQEAVTVNQQHVPLSSHQTSAGQLYGTVVSSATVVQSSQQKGAVQGAGVMWPWGDQLLITDRAQNEGLVGVVQPTLVTTSVSSCSLPVSYEAVSPPAASVDNMSFSLLDNLQFTGDTAGGYQLNSFLGSTVDTSTLFAAAAPYSLASALQPSRTDTWSAASAAVTSASFSATAAARLQPSVELHERSTLNVPSLANRQPNVELEKVQKQKSNLGIVVPMTHSSRDERGSTILQASSSCNVTMSVPSSLQSVAEQQSHYLTNTQTSVDKSTGPGADAAAGGIVLTNITGNVYVNQYTMMPGGTQPVDNALLHADLSAGAAASLMPYDNAADETMYSLAAPSVAFMLNTNNELGNFASAPVTSVATVQQPRNPQPQSRKAVAPESSFFGADAAPVLAAKPSNKFESCFLQFICGHKSETLSSVLNSPIKTRPVLPKYVPEPRRPKPAELPVNDTEDMTETIDEPIPATAKDVIDAPAQTSAAETAIATSMQSNTSTTVSVTTTTSEWPSITKLPAKFSHKWKNRTSLLSTVVTQSSVPVTSQTAPKVTAASEVASSKTSTSSVGVATQSASGKTKCQNTKWTVSKKTKSSKSQSSGLPVLVLKAVPLAANSRAPTTATKTTR